MYRRRTVAVACCDGAKNSLFLSKQKGERKCKAPKNYCPSTILKSISLCRNRRCFLKNGYILKQTKIFVWIVRGVPLMLQVIIVFYVPGFLLGTPLMTRFASVIVAFVINYACYFSEIYRGGIESISKGQYEAGQVLGMSKSQVFFKVILLQVIKRILAPMSNEVITLIKDTALARVVMIIELIKAAERFASAGLMWPLFYTAVFYLVLVGILTVLFNFFEKKLSYFKA